jgi:hypothetical protein
MKFRPKVIVAALGLSLVTTAGLGLPGAGTALAASPAAAGSVATASAAKSVTPAAASPCAGRSKTYIVKKFFRGPAVYPLRCGTSTWGYNHLIKHGYNPSSIALTVAQGTQIIGKQKFVYSSNSCPSFTYDVVFNTGALNGNGVQPQGIITAYQETASARAC